MKNIGAKILSKGAMIFSSLWIAILTIFKGMGKISLSVNEIVVSGVMITAVWTPTFISIITDKIKKERFIAQSVEASEQSRRVDLPEISDSIDLKKILQNWDESRTLFFLDETLNGKSITESFTDFSGKAAILCGPEGGFDKEEIELLTDKAYVKSVALGPRILRAETAAITALACFQALCGDWKEEKINENNDCR